MGNREKAWESKGDFPLKPAFPPNSSLCTICLGIMQEWWHAKDCQVHYFCKKCVLSYIEVIIKEGKDIRCPFYSCTAVITAEEICAFVGVELAKKWERKRLENLPNYRNCPNINCSGYILTSSTLASREKCRVCSQDLCSHCGKRWHSWTPCEDISLKELQDSKDLKPCPHCRRFQSKDHGCDHVSCLFCLQIWCWECSNPVTSTHYSKGSSDYCPARGKLLATDSAVRTDSKCLICCSRCCSTAIYVLAIAMICLLLWGVWPCICVGIAKKKYWEKKGTMAGVVVGGLVLWPLAPVLLGVIIGKYGARK